MKRTPLTDDMLTPPLLMGRIMRAHRCRVRESENNPIMTQNSCRALLFCLSHEEGLTQLELSKRAGLKPPTVSVALRHLEEEGYVVRETDTEDKRAARVYLSEKGQALERENMERFERIDNRMMRGFSAEETETLRKLLLRIKENLEDEGEEENE